MSWFMIIWFLIFFGLISVFIGIIVKSIFQWVKNNNSPVLSAPAYVVGRRTQHHKNGSSYYITFQFESGDRSEFYVPGRKYGLITEQDFGELTFQGTRFVSFERM